MPRLYSNENFPLPVVEELRRLGHNVLTLFESGQAGQAMPDPDVLAYAIAEDRVLVTLNRKHFIKLHTLDSQHPGIIVCTFDANFSDLALRIHDALQAGGDTGGKLIRINRPQQ